MNLLETLMNLSDEQTVYYCIEKRLLKNKEACEFCQNDLALVKTSRSIDGFSWRCFKKSCKNYGNYLSIRKNSFLENYNIKLKYLLLIIYYWSNKMQNKDIVKYVSVGLNAIKRIRKDLIYKIREYYKINPILLGGPGLLVQIDETMLNHKVKAHRGRSPVRQTWASGLVDCSTVPAKGFMCLIEDKSASTILPIINRHVRFHSTIHTDEAKVYHVLSRDNNYIHKSIIHKYNFVDYENSVHTQNIESYNNKVKLRIKAMKGIKSANRKNFLFEFSWLDNFSLNCYDITLDLIKINF